MGVSSSIEPIFAPVYERKFFDKNSLRTELVFDPLLTELVKDGKSIEHIVGAYDVTPEEHIKTQATIQEYVDQAISKTINISADFKNENMADLLLEYSNILKGVTVYKAGSRGNEPLKIIHLTEEEIKDHLTKKDVKVESKNQACATGACEL